MAYIGISPNFGNLSTQAGTGDGSDVTPIATLDYTVATSASIGVYLDGVRQVAGTDYTANGTTLTFTTAPPDLVKIEVVFFGLSVDIGTPGDDTVGLNQLSATGTASSSNFLRGDNSWTAVDALPTQTSHSGKYLTTNGSAASWDTLDTDANTTTKGLYEHAHTISANYSITSGNNALTAGPITIDTGISVTIPTGSAWVIA